MEHDYNEQDNYTDYQDEFSDPVVWSAGLASVAIYTIAFSVGIPANLYVLFRMRRLARNDVERYRNGTGIALCSMAAADLCSLLLIGAQNLLNFTPEPDATTDWMMRKGVCKALLFLTHTITGISIWSWLLLSSLRYLAICHPLYHLRLWQMPYRALAFIVSMSIFLNVWLLVAVDADGGGCTQDFLLPLIRERALNLQVPLMKNSATANRLFHIVECVWSFIIPCFVIVVMDTSVVLKSTSFTWFLETEKTGKDKRRRSALEEIIKLTRSNSGRARQQRALCRWLLIALVCVLLNTPENTLRLITLFGMPDFQNSGWHLSARMLAQALYFSQFAFNAIYLALFVYDKSSRSKHVHDGSNYNSHAIHLIFAEAFMQHFAAHATSPRSKRAKMEYAFSSAAPAEVPESIYMLRKSATSTEGA
ncbi:unnamed protein product, partial [Mesorhabditis spiculigera]